MKKTQGVGLFRTLQSGPVIDDSCGLERGTSIALEEWRKEVGVVSIAWVVLSLVALAAVLPALIFALSRRRGQPSKRAHIVPSVSLVIVGGDDRDLARKLGNSLALHYPPDQLEILVMSSGDRALEILRGLERRRVVGVYDAEPLEKAEALNRAVSRASGDIVILSDVASVAEPNAIRRLVRNFHDPRVGAVVGRRGSKLFPVAETGLFAFRKSAFAAVPARAMSVETYLALRLASDGWRVVFEPDAVVVRGKRMGVAGAVRMVVGAVQALVVSTPRALP